MVLRDVNLEALLAAQPSPPGPFPLVMHEGRRLFLRRKRLGAGAFGETYEYLMIDPVNGNKMRVAIKLLRYPGEHPDLRSAWITETVNLVVYAADAPYNPWIAEWLGIINYQGDLYIVIELCDGNLERLFGLPGYRGRDWVVPVGSAVLAGLNDLHLNRGVVHGDIRSPANVLYKYKRGQTDRLNPAAYTFRIADLGAAKRWDNHTAENPDNVDETLLTAELRDCAGLLLEVAAGGADNMPPETLDDINVGALLPGPAGEAVARAIRGEFLGDTGAREFLAALRA